jgi:hypothetical protein
MAAAKRRQNEAPGVSPEKTAKIEAESLEEAADP